MSWSWQSSIAGACWMWETHPRSMQRHCLQSCMPCGQQSTPMTWLLTLTQTLRARLRRPKLELSGADA